MDCFYVSVERLLDPSLEGKAIAVGGAADGRGVVASASYEAREYGVKSAMPMARAVSLCPHLTVVSGKYSRYSDYSRHIEKILLDFTPLVQMASQDEAYLDLTGTERLWGPALQAAQSIRERILAETELPCSLGASSKKLVSKIASGLCKPRGLLYVPDGSEEHFLAPLPVKRMPGVGPKTQQRLKEHGIEYLGQLAELPDGQLEALFGSNGTDLAARARGEFDSPVIVDEPAKSISGEETFGEDLTDFSLMAGVLSNLCEKVAYRVRKAACRSATVTLKYRYSDFETHTAAKTLPAPTDDEADLLEAARELLAKRWQQGRPVRLLGVAAGNLIYNRHQMDFLESDTEERKKRLHEAIDRARLKHGYGIMRRASSSGPAEEKNERQWG